MKNITFFVHSNIQIVFSNFESTNLKPNCCPIEIILTTNNHGLKIPLPFKILAGSIVVNFKLIEQQLILELSCKTRQLAAGHPIKYSIPQFQINPINRVIQWHLTCTKKDYCWFWKCCTIGTHVIRISRFKTFFFKFAAAKKFKE